LSIQYETFEHEADIGIRGFGGTMEEAFENAAVALYSVMVNISRINPAETKTVSVNAPDHELLLVEWLNALLSISDVERMVFKKFKVTMDGPRLSGTAWGEGLDRVRHEPKVEVKGATYHMLRVAIQDERYLAQCVVDV
jgi:SHS2 domain-containing protein